MRMRVQGLERPRMASTSTSSISSRLDASVSRAFHRSRRDHGAVLVVLVVVEKNAAALLLPPLAGGEIGSAALDLARDCQRRAAHLVEVPPPLDAHVDVDTARSRRLRPAAQATLVEHVA